MHQMVNIRTLTTLSHKKNYYSEIISSRRNAMIIQRYASLCGAVASTCRFKPMCYMNHILIEFMKYTRYIIHVAPATRFLHLTFSIRLPAVESNLSPERRYTERQSKIRSFQLSMLLIARSVFVAWRTVDVYMFYACLFFQEIIFFHKYTSCLLPEKIF